MHSTLSIYRLVMTLLASIVMLAGPASALQAQDSTPVHSGDSTAVRILSIDGDTGDLTILDGNSGETVASFTAAGAPGFVIGAGSDSSETILVNYYDGNKTVIIDSGLALHEHGSHYDLETSNPVIRTTVDASAPAHFWLHDGYVASVNDSDNTIFLWNEEDLATNAAPVVIPLQIDEPDHGSIVIANDQIYMGYYGNGSVQTYSLEGALINDHIAECPGTHGEAVVDDLVLFACNEDVLILNQDGEQGRIAYPESSGEPIRANLLATTENPNLVAGDSPDGLIIFDLESQTSSLIAMDAPIRSIASASSTIVALDANGTLHGIDPEAMTVLWSTPVAMGHSEFSAEESNMFYPFIGVGAGSIYVADPGSGAIIVVNAATGEVANTIEVGGRPARVVIVTATGFEH